jgi:hypothetical protein
MAVKHPSARIGGKHIHRYHLGREKRDHVCALAVAQHDIAVPLWRVLTDTFAERKQIPADVLSLFHGHKRPRGVDVAIDRETAVGNGNSGPKE